MTETARAVPRDDFWRCGACGAPHPARAFVTRCVACGAARPVLRIDAAEGRGRRVLVASWAYAVLILAVLASIRWVGQAWWGVTLLVFLPRWLFLAPLVLLAAASAWVRRPSHWALQGATALVVLGPLMALSLPIGQLGRRPPEGERFRILCLNRGMAKLNTRRLIDLIGRERVDVICFQEGSFPDPELDAFLDRGWHRDASWSLLSRYPIVAELPRLDNDSTTEDRYSARLARVRVRTPSGSEFVLASTHLPTLRFGFYRFLNRDVPGLSQHIAWWDHEMGRVVNALAETRDEPLLVGGDFNMPSDDSTMAALAGAYRFAFEEAGWGYGYTRPTKAPWVRIDHILTSPEWVVTRCWVGPDVGSDHLPVLAEVILPSLNPKGHGE